MADEMTRAAPPVGDDGLPPLPLQIAIGHSQSDIFYGYTADQVREAQREAYEAGRRARGVTEILMNPPYGEPDLYARLHTSLADQIAVAKERGKLEAWFNAARSLLEYEAGQHGFVAAVPAQTGTQRPADLDASQLEPLLKYWFGLGDCKGMFNPGRLLAFANAARRAAVSTASAPDGWKLVPIEPTDEMRTACKVLNYADDIDAEWARLLAAAPSSPVE